MRRLEFNPKSPGVKWKTGGVQICIWRMHRRGSTAATQFGHCRKTGSFGWKKTPQTE